MKSFVPPSIDEVLGRSAPPSTSTRSTRLKASPPAGPSSQPSKKRARPDPAPIELDSTRHPVIRATEALFPRGVPEMKGSVLDDPFALQAMQGVTVLVYELERLQSAGEGLQQAYDKVCEEVGKLKSELKAVLRERDRALQSKENAEEERARTAEAMAEVRAENQLVRDKFREVIEQATLHTKIFMMKEMQAGKADSWDLAGAIAEYEHRFEKLEDDEAEGQEVAEDSGAGSAVGEKKEEKRRRNETAPCAGFDLGP